MNRKNAFSYFIWFLYSIAVCAGLLGITATFSRQMGQAESIGIAVGGVWLLFCALIARLIHRLVKKQSNETRIGRLPAIVAESLMVVLFLVTGMILRIYCIGNIGTQSPYFDLAKVSAEQGLPTVVHGAVHIYIQLLHLVYVIFGNIFMAGIWLQILLQMLAGVFLYLAVRKMTGVVTSVIMWCFFCFSPMMINEALTLSPKMLFLAVFSLCLYLCTKCIRDRNRILSCIVAGVLIALVCYLDILGIVLLIFTVTGILWTEGQTEISVKRRLVGVLLCLAGSVAGFALTLAVDSLASGKGIGSIFQAWWKLFVPSTFDASILLKPEASSLEVVVLIMLMTFGIFSFWSVRKTENQSIWTLAIIGVILLQVSGMTTDEVSGGVFLYLLAAVLAGIGVSGLFAKDAVTGSCVWDDGKLEAQLEAMSQEFVNEEAPAIETPAVEAPRVKFIENPLPLPKKHVKKVMDFDFEPEEGMDDFDVDVDDDDDFDI